MRKDRLDGQGLAVILGVTALLAFNQIIIKLVNAGLQPVSSSRACAAFWRSASWGAGFGTGGFCRASAAPTFCPGF